MSKLVRAIGPLNAKIAIVGEAPGVQEEIEGEPFVGGAGHLLTHMLQRGGTRLKDCWRGNVMEVRPGGNNFGQFYEDSKRRVPKPALVRGWKRLRGELLELRPNIILACGGEALRALVGEPRSIEKWRGSLLNTPFGKVMPTYHPAFILRVYQAKVPSEIDIKRMVRESLTRDFVDVTKDFHFELFPSLGRVLVFLSEVRRKKTKVSFDCETSSDLVRCLGFADSRTHAICIPFITNRLVSFDKKTIYSTQESRVAQGNSYWSPEDEVLVIDALAKVLEDPEVPKIAQNFPFDATMLARDFGIQTKGLWMDTMVVHHCCYSELPKSLDYLAASYTEIPFYSDYDAASDDSTFEYNCFDCVATFQVAEVLEVEARDLGVWEFYKEFSEKVMIALTQAGNFGVKVNVEERTKIHKTVVEELAKLTITIREKTGFDLNPNSPPQMKEFLYVKLGLPRQWHHKTNKETTDADAIAKLRVKFPKLAPIFDTLLKHRKLTKFKGTYLESELSETGRLETSYGITKTVTGRISSSKTLSGRGGNLQNIPKNSFRRLFIPVSGKVFVKADLSQAEARAVAWFSRANGLIERFQDPEFDVHVWNASIVFRKPESEVTPDERERGKTLVHGANYNIGPVTAGRASGVPVSQARVSLFRYYEAIPEIPRWWGEIRDALAMTRRLINPMGRVRYFLDRLNDATYRSAYSQLPQSTVADLNNWAFWHAAEELPEEAFPLLQVHDEMVISCLKKDEEEVREMVKVFYDHPLDIEGVDVPLVIPVEITSGLNWWDVK